MEESKKENKIVYILLMIIMLLFGIIIGYGTSRILDDKKEENSNCTEEKESTKETNKEENTSNENNITIEEDNNSFSYNMGESGYGIATVTGYITTEKVIESDVYFSGAPTYDLIYFNIVDSKNDNFLKYLKDHDGNTFVSEKKFAIGCLENNKIVYNNFSDSTGMKEYEITSTDTNKLMNSTKETPVKLEIEIYKNTQGFGAPKCYSWISTVKVK